MGSSKVVSRLNLVIIPVLATIIKISSWRKYSKFAHGCKSVTERLTSPDKSPLSPDDSEPPHAPLPSLLSSGGPVEFSFAEVDKILNLLISSCGSVFCKIVDPALDAVQKLIAHGYIIGEIDPSGGLEVKLLARVMESVCKCHDLGDEAVELMVLQTLLSVVLSILLRIHGVGRAL